MRERELLAGAAGLTAVPLQRLVDGLSMLIGQGQTRPVQLFLADYRHDTLVPALGVGPDIPIDVHPAGRCYIDQRPQREALPAGGQRLWLPVSTHGDRLGVLSIDTDDSGSTAAADEALLDAVAAIAGRTLAAGVSVSDGYLAARRVRWLTVAAEMQWALLPGNSFADEFVTIAGQLEPAYAASGDAYDWCRSSDELLVAVFDAQGRGIEAALQTTLAVTAFRNARRGGLDLAQMVSLTDQALYDRSRGQWSLPAFFFQFDLATGQASAIHAGSPVALRQREATVSDVDLDPQLPLGMFEGTVYTAEAIDVTAGDRLLVVTDGAHTPRDSPVGPMQPETLRALLAETADSPVWELTRKVINNALRHSDGQPDQDIVAVALDLHRR